MVLVTARDPSTWIPDPFSDYVTEARWNFFETETTLSALKGMDGFDEDEVLSYCDEELRSNRTYRNEAAGTNDVEDGSKDKVVSIYE